MAVNASEPVCDGRADFNAHKSFRVVMDEKDPHEKGEVTVKSAREVLSKSTRDVPPKSKDKSLEIRPILESVQS